MFDVVYGIKFINNIIVVVRIKFAGRKTRGFERFDIEFMMNFENL